jgi:hypothetical protein
MSEKTESGDWNSNTNNNRKKAVDALWVSLSLKTKLKLVVNGFRKYQSIRKSLIEDPLDIWFPFFFGLIGLGAVLYALITNTPEALPATLLPTPPTT